MLTLRSGGSPTWARLRSRALRWAPWVAPLLVAYTYYTFSEKRVLEVIGLCLALAIYAVLVRRPGAALVALAVLLPLQDLGFGLLLGLHVPASLLHDASFFKELLALSVLGAALQQFRHGGQRLDKIDRWLLAYVAWITAYLIVPHLFSTTAPSSSQVRLLAWRSDAAYVLVFFGARHAAITDRARRRFVQSVVGIGVLTSILAVYQRVAVNSWTHFVVVRAHMPQYFVRVLHQTPAQATNALAYVTQVRPVRVSSIFLNPNDMSDFLVFVVAILAERIVRDRRTPRNYLFLALVMAALFFSQVRADTLGAAVVLGLVVLPAARRPTHARVRLLLAYAVAAAIIVPSIAGTRYVGGQGGNAKEATSHLTEIQFGIKVLSHHPLGLGLGDQPSTASRFQAQTGNQARNVVADNSILQVGDELGWPALVPWLAFVVLVLLEARRRAQRGDPLAAAAGLGLLGVLVAGEYHHVFLLFPVPWLVWATVGLALSTNRVAAPADTRYYANPAARGAL